MTPTSPTARRLTRLRRLPATTARTSSPLQHPDAYEDKNKHASIVTRARVPAAARTQPRRRPVPLQRFGLRPLAPARSSTSLTCRFGHPSFKHPVIVLHQRVFVPYRSTSFHRQDPFFGQVNSLHSRSQST
jgi:hypothetical protein